MRSGGRKRWTVLRPNLALLALVPFCSAFLGGLLAFGLVMAPQATAQSNQLQEVRATAFTLVGPDGTVLAELGTSATQNAGRLLLRDAAGTQRVVLVGTGTLNVFDEEGTTMVFRAGRNYGGEGAPRVNGVELGPGGSISTIPTLP
jgi:hypothetical protein